VADSAGSGRFYMQMLGVFAGVALVLAAIGIYGVVSYSVARRTREIGVRVALGAGSANIIWLVLSRVLAVIGAGLVVGIAGALALTRFLSSLVYEVSVTDRTTFGAVAAVLTAVAVAAAYFPALRAMRVNPVTALRHE
jgi:putative ABC transport system permease protein